MAGCLQRSVVVLVLGYPDHSILFSFLMKFDRKLPYDQAVGELVG